MASKLKSWAEILRAVSTPLHFFALLVLVSEVVLGTIALRVQGTLQIVLGLATLVFLLVLLGLVAFLAIRYPYSLFLHNRSGRPDTPDSELKYDAFLSSPMAGFGDDDRYRAHRGEMKRLADVLEAECDFKRIYSAALAIESQAEFEEPGVSLREDLEALHDSRYFVLVLPERVVSSVTVEAGYALALSKTSIYLVRRMEDLPFLLRQAPHVFSNVMVYQYADEEDLLRLVRNNRMGLFGC